MEGLTTIVTNVQRYSTEDGPGIRTTVFFKGCPLACPWCHNPEGIAREPELAFSERKCIGCKECMVACPFGAIHYNPKTARFFKCDLCGGEPECVKWCVTGGVQYITDMDKLLVDKRARTAERTVKSVTEGQTSADGGA